jgi:hypothetical protein
MMKTLYSVILLTAACLAIMFTLSPARANAQFAATPGDSSTASSFNTNHAELNYLNQTESPGPMMAQAEAQAAEHYCVGHCRRHYEERLVECNEPGHPHHHRCEEWARERERECLDGCYKEHPRY